jgi:hypothetical protein
LAAQVYECRSLAEPQASFPLARFVHWQILFVVLTHLYFDRLLGSMLRAVARVAPQYHINLSESQVFLGNQPACFFGALCVGLAVILGLVSRSRNLSLLLVVAGEALLLVSVGAWAFNAAVLPMFEPMDRLA